MRNATADLMAKHWVDVSVWRENLGHIKWNKMTSSLLVTALAFPLLSFIKEGIHLLSSGYGGIEFAATFLAVSLVDSLIQFATRKCRGFDQAVAKLDMLRPVVGDAGSVLLFWAMGWDLGANFGYLLVRKLFAEGWSGVVEGRQKYQEKIAQRRKNFHKIFDLDNYKIPDPAALAAINLVYIMSAKSQACLTYQKFLRAEDPPGYDLRQKMVQVHLALFADYRIKETISFIFPHGDWQVYGERMLAEFHSNRRRYLAWLKNNDPLFFRTVITDLMKAAGLTPE